jgi:hypothetical protein
MARATERDQVPDIEPVAAVVSRANARRAPFPAAVCHVRPSSSPRPTAGYRGRFHSGCTTLPATNPRASRDRAGRPSRGAFGSADVAAHMRCAEVCPPGRPSGQGASAGRRGSAGHTASSRCRPATSLSHRWRAFLWSYPYPRAFCVFFGGLVTFGERNCLRGRGRQRRRKKTGYPGVRSQPFSPMPTKRCRLCLPKGMPPGGKPPARPRNVR